MNVGKVFEQEIKDSLPSYILVHRLNDSAQAFGNSSNLRFSSKSPFDYIFWDSRKRYLYAIELKSVSTKSISFERTKNDKGAIHLHQIIGLNKWDSYNGTICGFIIEFREIETTIFINIKDFNILIDKINKKSFNINDLENKKIPYLIIPQRKKRTRIAFDMDYFFKKNTEV